MDKRTLRLVEFDKIIKKLESLTASELGRETAGALLPNSSIEDVDRTLKETSDGTSFILRRGTPPMGGVHDIRGTLKRVEVGAVLNPGELLYTAEVLWACRNLKSYSREVDETRISGEEPGSNIVGELIGKLETNRRIEDKIKLAIISEEEISDGASHTLSTIRRQIRENQDSIKDKLNNIIRSSRYQKYMQEAIVTMRGDRYVIPVKQEYRSEIPGLVHDSSSSGATLFIEPMAVVEANNSIKELKLKERAEIERILAELTYDVSSILTALKSNMEILARLDFIFAKARLSMEYDCVCPRLATDGSIVIKKGRHPLIDKKDVVPIDFWIGEDFRTLVVTGPNTGGKTVTLKTIGLFVLMAQAGLHIPANEGTKVSVFRNVFADIGDEQSIEQSLSTFSSHMTNIIKILRKVDNKSLVLFDELGAGTDPTEGAALAMAILEQLHSLGAVTVATTHYSELKIYAISTKGVENACCEFDVATLKPTYRLLIGIPGKSNAFAISKRLGLTDDVLLRAREFLTKEDLKFEDVLMSIEKNRSESEKERMRAESQRLEIEALKKEIEEQKRRIKSQREKILKAAREEAKNILLETKRETQFILEEMKELQKEQTAADRNKAVEELRQKLKSNIDEIESSLHEPIMPRKGYAKPPKNLKPGDSVLIINLNRKGTVKIPPDKSNEAIVQVGIMEINVHVTNLRLIDDQEEEIQKTGSGRISMSKSLNISTEIDLRGYTVDDAIEDVDKFLDDASISGLNEITIIHGKGTGALRSGIHQFLKAHPHVKTFRLGKYGEGETGVTIVELK